MVGLNHKHYVTPAGFDALKAECHNLLTSERPQVVETVRWAAGNGDRSENGDYIYGKKRLREIDHRIRYLTKRIENAVVVYPEQQTNKNQVFFGATISYQSDCDNSHIVKIVGLDEADASQEKISYISPLAKALLKSRVGDIIQLQTPSGLQELEIMEISYHTNHK